jgi:hypothetical protein
VNGKREVPRLTAQLTHRSQQLYWLDGNHEDFARLYAVPVELDGLRHLAPRITHLPRGYRTKLNGNRSLAVLGGAASIDRFRRSRTSWWRQELITDEDLAALGTERADIMIGHDAPVPLPALDACLERTKGNWPHEMLDYAAAGRARFHIGFARVRPLLYLGGHYHRAVDETFTFAGTSGEFTTRAVLVDRIAEQRAATVAILNTKTLELEFRTTSGSVVDRGGHERRDSGRP